MDEPQLSRFQTPTSESTAWVKEQTSHQEGRVIVSTRYIHSFPNTMRVATLILGLLATAVSSVSATALTYKLDANEKACFYTQVDQQNVKVAFYFAVSN